MFRFSLSVVFFSASVPLCHFLVFPCIYAVF
nr:MAG TPA: hypothetical protein [Caudoviricetes sp.]